MTTLQVAAAGSAEFSTIQAAIDAAAAGGTINVAAGVFTEAIQMRQNHLSPTLP